MAFTAFHRSKQAADCGIAELSVAERQGVCVQCGHAANTSARRLLSAFAARRRGPARCRASDCGDNPTGWPDACGCSAAFHGS